MSATREDLGDSRIRLHITVDPEACAGALDPASGGGGEEPRREVLGPVLRDAVRDAIRETGIRCISIEEDSVRLGKISREEGVEFDVDAYVYPEVELGSFEGLKAARRVHAITEAEVEGRIEAIRCENVRWVPVDRAARMDDTLVMDYVATLAGDASEVDRDSALRYLLGSDLMIPGFDEMLVGMLAGEDRDLSVRLAGSGKPELDGRELRVAVHVRSVEERQLPDLDDEFAQDVSEHDTMDELRKALALEMQAEYEEMAESELEEDLLTQVADRARMDVPPPLVSMELRHMCREQMDGLPLREASAAGCLEDAELFDEGLVSAAYFRARQQAALTRLLEAWGLRREDASNRERYLAAAAEEEGVSVEELLGRPAEDVDRLVDIQAVAAVLARLKEMAEIEEISDEEARRRSEAHRAEKHSGSRPGA